MIDDVRDIIKEAMEAPDKSFPKIKALAESSDWIKREDAATALVEISKKKMNEVLAEMNKWVENEDENVRRTAVESLRYIARVNQQLVLPILEKTKEDESLYVRKAISHILREISKKNADLVFDWCKKWATLKSKNTQWIIKDGTKKLSSGQQEELKSLFGE